MQFDRFRIPGPLLLTPKRIEDSRGWFMEVFREDLFAEQAGAFHFVQHNQSLSRDAGTVRGLHFQVAPRAQGKLVRCIRGRIFDVAVDLRDWSPHRGSHIAVELTSSNGKQLWVPEGFAHGFATLEDDTEVAYAVTDTYSPEHDRGLRWNDPALGIQWPVSNGDAIVSEKDARQPFLADIGSIFGHSPSGV